MLEKVEYWKALVHSLERTMGDMEATADMIAKEAPSLDMDEKAQVILAMEAGLERLDRARKIYNRTLNPIRHWMAKAILTDPDSQGAVELHGYRFEVTSCGHYSPPPKTKQPALYADTIKWLVENVKDGSRNDPETGQPKPPVVLEETKVSIDGRQFQEVCEELLVEGKSLPPNTSEFNQLAVETKKSRKKNVRPTDPAFIR